MHETRFIDCLIQVSLIVTGCLVHINERSRNEYPDRAVPSLPGHNSNLQLGKGHAAGLAEKLANRPGSRKRQFRKATFRIGVGLIKLNKT